MEAMRARRRRFLSAVVQVVTQEAAALAALPAPEDIAEVLARASWLADLEGLLVGVHSLAVAEAQRTVEQVQRAAEVKRSLSASKAGRAPRATRARE